MTDNPELTLTALAFVRAIAAGSEVEANLLLGDTSRERALLTVRVAAVAHTLGLRLAEAYALDVDQILDDWTAEIAANMAGGTSDE